MILGTLKIANCESDNIVSGFMTPGKQEKDKIAPSSKDRSAKFLTITTLCSIYGYFIEFNLTVYNYSGD